MKMIFKILVLVLHFTLIISAQSQHRIMSYNLLNYPGSDTTTRNPYFRTIFSTLQPDILIVQEMTSQAGVNGFLNNVLNSVSSGYAAGQFIDGFDTDNAIFYKSASFTFLSNSPIQTELRDINEFKLRNNISGDTLIIYSLHLKASSGSANEQQRAAEIDSLRKRTNSLNSGTNFIVVGDYNIYGASEPAYQKLVSQSGSGYLIDINPLSGDWSQQQYAAFHTQSPRVRSFGGGATGGMDDRFDMILMSQSVIDEGGIKYVPGTYTVYGNDGNHYNDSINRPPNNVVTQTIANALHYASDHLPVYADFEFNQSMLQLTSFSALIEGMYNGFSMVPDTVTIELRESTYPYTLVDQTKIFLNSSGTGSGTFASAVNGVPYYIVLKHRNSIETWSSSPQVFTSNSLAFDFASSSASAYQNNLKQVGNKWCIISGDVNQDGFVDSEDLSIVFSGNATGLTGYVPADINGDLTVGVNDVIKVYENNLIGAEIKAPPGYVK
ncbi:MAG: hypothetical protein IPM56_13885 [Ignavibacteriales bacterium]|nr:MAG: hypothetical protein IPM56_13885 [Ignavibacteriales bacterium]